MRSGVTGLAQTFLLTVVALCCASVGSADETCQSPYLPKLEGQEDFVYVWTLGVEGLGVQHGVHVASHHLGRADADFSVFARRGRAAPS